ncbi:MAG: DEAD/DEAH box helicase [Lachnospiraceae bacterium]|nr:DEAD/DEAH box helicase [Lachnospiraceae bacterium]
MAAEDRRQYKDFAMTIRRSDYRLSEIASTRSTLRNEVRNAYRNLQISLAVDLLKEMDIEQINVSKDGIRVKAFRDMGLKTVADVFRATQRSLESIPGVGPVMAAKAKRNAEALRISASRTVRVRVDREHPSAESRKLVHSVGILMRADTFIDRAADLYSASHDGLTARLAVSECLGNGFSWFFTSNEKKQQARLAYSELQEYVYAEYARNASDIIDGYNAAVALTEAEAWQVFSDNSAPYYALLFSVIEGNTEAITDYGGIPAELVEKVNRFPLVTEGLQATLRRYQVFGAKYILTQERVLLGDEMGLGKTIEAIAAITHLRAEGKTHFLVVCPLSVLMNWQHEVAKFCTVPVDEIYGYDRSEELTEWLEKGGTAITTYETASKIDLPDRFAIDLLVVDEAQYIKNPDTLRTKAVRHLIGRSQKVLLMTGTPMENRVDEMVRLIGFLQPETAANARRYTSLSEAEQFREQIAPVYLRRTREQVLGELPDKEEIIEWGMLTPEETEAYRKALASNNYMEIRRISWNLPAVSESTKAKRMLELIEEAEADGRKTIVFSFFRETLQNVAMLVGERCAGVIDGSVPMQRREEILQKFREDESKTVLVCQVVAGGVGLNVQAASVIIFCEPQLKPSMEEQAVGRAYRMGQSRKVLVHRLLISDSVDERILSILADKREAFLAFADESVIGKMDVEQEITTAAMQQIIEEEKKRYQVTEQKDETDDAKEDRE